MHEGHRLRMFEKMKGDGAALADHELLEILLFNALPRKNTNPLSHLLLDTFGSLDGVFSADVESLMKIEGLGRQGASYLRCVGLLFKRLNGKNRRSMPRVFDPDGFADYLVEHFSSFQYEAVEFFFIDSEGNILLRKTFTTKEKDKVELIPAEITKIIMQNSKNSLILAHNHLQGGCLPSKADDEMTKQCEVLCSINNVRLLDHFICAGKQVYSYYQSGKMKDISKDYHIHNILKRKATEA